MITENFTAFLNTGHFAVTATIGGAPVNGIPSREYVEVQVGRTQVVGYRPTFTCATSDVFDVASNTAAVVEGVNYTVAYIENDGTGISRIILEDV